MSFTSQFANVLRTNYVPTPTEIDAIEQTLQDPTAELRTLEDQLLQLQKQLETKTAKRDDWSRNIAEHERLLTPFRCLPDDILIEVFMACLPTTHEAIMDCNEPPLILGYVCRRWRSIAYHTPRLWATLHIAIPTSPSFWGPVNDEKVSHFKQSFEQKIRQHQTRISTWLSRSKTCPLSISSHDNPSSSSWSGSPAKSYYDLVLNFSDRIWKLNLNVPNHQLASDLLATIPFASFPHLRILSLEFPRRRGLRHRRVFQKWKNSGLLNVPNLTYLSISMCPFHFEEMNVNWSHLTHISVSGANLWPLGILDARKIFTHCPRLRFCAIEILCTENTSIAYTPFSLPYLHTLSVVDGSTGLDDLFQYADIPSLRNLTYHSISFPELDTRRSPLLVILSRTNTRLERLTTNIQFFTLVDLLECFDMTPSLTHLTNIRWKLLTPAANRPVYLPKLQVIDFDSTALDMRLSDWELIKFIRCRMDNASRNSDAQVAALTEVSIVSTNDMEVDIRAHLSEYISNGMELNLTYRDTDIASSGNWTPIFPVDNFYAVDEGDYL
ncbi:hypothetical protein BJ912DRAFT_997772 [Pholiota molesta]|nr:hypothetical protein BJ912DRAFT_997772 [Pholiota molesta]